MPVIDICHNTLLRDVPTRPVIFVSVPHNII